MKKIMYLSIVMFLAMISCKNNNEKQENDKQSDKINVKISKIVSYEGENNRNYSGVIEAKNRLPISFATAGTVTRVFVEEGQWVKKGQLLAKLDCSNAYNMYMLTNSKQEQAQDAYNRLEPMKDNGTLPEIKWIEVETGLNQAKAATSIAKKRMINCNLYATTSGVIGKKNIQVGMNILPINTALDILDISKVNVKASVPENEINFLKKGDTATIYISAINKTFEGTIKEIGVSADMFSHSYPVKITILNSKNKIKPGMVCSVKIKTKTDKIGYLILNKALQNDMNGQFVYVVNENKSYKKSVKTIEFVGQKVLVTGNLKEGDNIIISGQQKLQEASDINILK